MKRVVLISVFIIATFLFFVLFIRISNSTKLTKHSAMSRALNNKEKRTEYEKIKEEKVEKKVITLPSQDNIVDNRFENKEIKALIGKLGSEDIEVSQDAARKLAEVGKSAIPGLLEALKQADIALRGQIVFLLGRIRDKEAVPALVQILRDENAYIRRNCAEALGKIKDEDAIAPLSTSLFDEDPGVRNRSAWALGEIKDTRAVGSLLDRMLDEKDEMVKTSVVNSLGKIHDQRATLVLVKELKSKTGYSYQNKVVKALGQIGDVSAIAALSEHLEKLKQYNPTEKMIIFQWKEAIRITEEAINKIKNQS